MGDVRISDLGVEALGDLPAASEWGVKVSDLGVEAMGYLAAANVKGVQVADLGVEILGHRPEPVANNTVNRVYFIS